MANTNAIQPVIEAFMHRQPHKAIANTKTDGTTLFLHCNAIARWWPNAGPLEVTDAGYNTILTRHRLNSIPGVSVYSRHGDRRGRDGELTLQGEAWDGEWKTIQPLIFSQ